MTLRNITKQIIAFLLVLLVCIGVVMGGQGNLSASADDDTAQFEQTNVMDDLENSTVDEKAFDVRDYAFDNSKEAQILMLVEYCYSFYANLQENFGLYLYVWNPQGLKFDTGSSLNAVQLSYGSEDDYVKYSLEYLNRSEHTNYEGLFYKFKVRLSLSQREAMLEALNSSERTYHISGMELLEAGESLPHEYAVNAVYTYSGYAQGYGPNEGADTLTYTRSEGEVFVIEDDDLHQTFYRPSGNVSGSFFKQDTLHTVYFSVPNELIEKYGRLAVIRVQWLEAVLAPFLITGNQAVYNALQSYLGKSMGEYNEEGFGYGILGGYEERTTSLGELITTHRTAELAYNPWYRYLESADRQLERICLAFNSGEETDSADTYRVGGETLLDRMKEYSRSSTDKVLGTYARELFSSVDEAFTVVDIPAEKEYSLTSEKISQTFWEKVFGTSHVEYSDTFDGIEAIHPVSEQDFGASKEQTCQNLYIDLNDYDEFSGVYEEAKRNNETVYLFRFDQSEYSAWEVTQGKWEKATQWVPNAIGPGGSFQTVYKLSDSDTNGYFAEETVYLGLDLIQMEWDDGEKRVVIPIVSSPIDVVADGTPPVHTTSDKGLSWWQILLAVLALILVVWLLLKFAPVLVFAVGKVIALPFKAIGAASKNLKERRKEKKQEKAREKEEQEERYRQVMAEDYPIDYLSDEEWDYIEAMSHWEDDL